MVVYIRIWKKKRHNSLIDSRHDQSVVLSFAIKSTRHNNPSPVKPTEKPRPLPVISSHCSTISDTMVSCHQLVFADVVSTASAKSFCVSTPHWHTLFTQCRLHRQVSSFSGESLKRFSTNCVPRGWECESMPLCFCVLCLRITVRQENTRVRSQGLWRNRNWREILCPNLPLWDNEQLFYPHNHTRKVWNSPCCWETVVRSLRLMGISF